MTGTWPTVELAKLATVLSGFAFDSTKFSTEAGMPLVRIRDVSRGWSDTYFNGDCDPKFIVNDGDLLVGMDGQFNRELWRGGKALLNQRVCRITSDGNNLDQRYLYHFLPQALRRIEDATPFVTVKHLSAPKVKGIRVPLPPLEEQRRIAAVLDQADGLRGKRRASLAALDKLTKSIFVDMFGDPAHNPMNWPVLPIGKVGRVVTGNTPSRTVPEYFGNDIEWIKSDNINTPEYFVTSAAEGLSAAGRAIARVAPPSSILVTCIAGSPECIGNSAMTDRPVAFNQQINALIPEFVNPDFIYAQ